MKAVADKITVQQAADKLGITPRGVRELIRRGVIRAERWGGKLWAVDAGSLAGYKPNPRHPGRPPEQPKRRKRSK